MIDTRFMTSWSGGKDSCYAFMLAAASGLTPVVLLNMLNEDGKISRSHAIPKNILERQAGCLGLPIITRAASWQNYEKIFIESLHEIKSEYQVGTAVFGDIDLQEHRDWEEKVCNAAGLNAMLPLWKKDRKALVLEMIDHGIEAYIVSCNETMGPAFLGRKIERALIPELEKIGVDPCGENGEYHTLVTHAPCFSKTLSVTFGKELKHDRYWFVDLRLRSG
jgi:diphthine-ammonia ligase